MVQQHPLKPDEPTFLSNQMILGIRGHEDSPSHIRVQDASDGDPWEWSPSKVGGSDNLPEDIKWSIKQGHSITEVKWVANGTKILAVVGNAAVVLNYAPNDPNLDKRVVFAIHVKHTHTLELLPNDYLAVATTGSSYWDGIEIYDLQTSKPRLGEPGPRPVQTIRGFPAVHGLLWDETSQKLWAVGNDKNPGGEEPSQALLRGYSFNPNFCHSRTTILIEDEVDEYPISIPKKLTDEWGPSTWWDVPHDLAGIPFTRKMLITTDLNVFGFDLESRTFLDDFDMDTILDGFEPVSRPPSLPRSDIKCISMNGDGEIMYVQAKWMHWFGYDVRIIDGDGRLKKIDIPTTVYKARWFAEIPGWPAA
jgi:hypothetical protein